MKRGQRRAEVLLFVTFLALALLGGVAIFGDELFSALGLSHGAQPAVIAPGR